MSKATAGSGRASLEATDSPQINPGSIAFLRGYFFSASTGQALIERPQSKEAALEGQSESDRLQRKVFSLRLTDRTKGNQYPASLSYDQVRSERRSFVRDSGPLSIQDFQLSLGEFAGTNVGFGMALKYRDEVLSEDRWTQWNSRWGLLWALSPDVGLSWTLDNPEFSRLGRVPEELRLGTQTAFAVNYNYTPKLRMKLDLLSDPSHSFRKPELLAGVETYLTQWWVLRAGFGMDFLRQSRRQALGVGFVGPRFSLHYAQTQSSASAPETPMELARNAQNEHVFDLLLSIW